MDGPNLVNKEYYKALLEDSSSFFSEVDLIKDPEEQIKKLANWVSDVPMDKESRLIISWLCCIEKGIYEGIAVSARYIIPANEVSLRLGLSISGNFKAKSGQTIDNPERVREIYESRFSQTKTLILLADSLRNSNDTGLKNLGSILLWLVAVGDGDLITLLIK